MQYNFQNGPASVNFLVHLGVKINPIAKMTAKRKMSVPKDHPVEGELYAKGNQVYKRIRPSNHMAIEVVLEVDPVAP